MPAENAKFIDQLKPSQPQGGESISEGDDHLRVIKEAVVGSFPKVGGTVNATHEDLNMVPELITDVAAVKKEVEDLDKTSHGNVASCYWNPTFGQKLAYSHNVADVVVNPADSSGMQTKVLFTQALDGDPHYSFNLTPVNGTARPTIITVVGLASDHISFLSWQLVGEDWTAIPATELSFSLMVNDMDSGQ